MLKEAREIAERVANADLNFIDGKRIIDDRKTMALLIKLTSSPSLYWALFRIPEN